jgi:hypothetical protein
MVEGASICETKNYDIFFSKVPSLEFLVGIEWDLIDSSYTELNSIRHPLGGMYECLYYWNGRNW